jgi:cytochrome oxidase assembly protein ShyY1
MARPLSAARRMFAPTLRFTLLALLVAGLFVRLGWWQWHKGEERQAAAARFARGTDQVFELGTRAVDDIPLYQRVSVDGELDGAHQFLLDNRIFAGRAGYEVLTPLVRVDAPALLVDRGWLPFSGSRARLPDVTLAERGPVRLTGRIAALPAPGLASGRAAPGREGPWPRVTSYPDMAQLAAALGAPLASRIVLLDPAAPYGYARAWQPPGLPPLRHFSYAIQWWTFALATLVLWAVLSRRRLPPPTPA